MSTAGQQQLPANAHLNDWLPLLTVSVREVFETMLGTKLAPAFEPSRTTQLDWTATVGLAGQLSGVVQFSCSEKSATQIASKMLAIQLAEADERAADAVGEVCNMIAGNFKHKINGLSDHCLLSPPMVVSGTDYRVHRQTTKATQSLQITFAFEGAPIYVLVAVRS
jgi:chemotaxis protein CheX